MRVFRVLRPYTDFDMMHLEHMRKVIKQGRELLANTPVPDAFVGRRTQEPFPQEDEEHMAQWVGSRELEPPK